MRIEMPEGLRLTFVAYVKSPSADINTTISLVGVPAIEDEGLDMVVKSAINAANNAAGVADFRAMTDEEIVEYVTEEE